MGEHKWCVGHDPEIKQESESDPEFFIVGGRNGDKPGARARQGREHASCVYALACLCPWVESTVDFCQPLKTNKASLVMGIMTFVVLYLCGVELP